MCKLIYLYYNNNLYFLKYVQFQVIVTFKLMFLNIAKYIKYTYESYSEKNSEARECNSQQFFFLPSHYHQLDNTIRVKFLCNQQKCVKI